MHNRMPRIVLRGCRAGVPMLLAVTASIASAQWSWRDEHGRPVYSDQPPPPTVRAGDILRQPMPAPIQPSDSPDALAQPSSNAVPPQPAPSAAVSPAPKPPTTAEREQEFRRRMKERTDAERKLADAQSQAAQKAQDCERARGYMKSLDDGVRLVRTNPDGNRELLNEAQRQAEVERTREVIEARCH